MAPALVHAQDGGGVVRPPHARHRARALGGGPAARRRHHHLPHAERGSGWSPARATGWNWTCPRCRWSRRRYRRDCWRRWDSTPWVSPAARERITSSRWRTRTWCEGSLLTSAHFSGSRSAVSSPRPPAGGTHDFVSRFFAPVAGRAEDHVTGFAHCLLGPYWQRRLGKDRLAAYQASERGGSLQVTVKGERVILGGQAVTVVRGELAIPFQPAVDGDEGDDPVHARGRWGHRGCQQGSDAGCRGRLRRPPDRRSTCFTNTRRRATRVHLHRAQGQVVSAG